MWGIVHVGDYREPIDYAVWTHIYIMKKLMYRYRNKSTIISAAIRDLYFHEYSLQCCTALKAYSFLILSFWHLLRAGYGLKQVVSPFLARQTQNTSHTHFQSKLFSISLIIYGYGLKDVYTLKTILPKGWKKSLELFLNSTKDLRCRYNKGVRLMGDIWFFIQRGWQEYNRTTRSLNFPECTYTTKNLHRRVI